MLQSDLTSSNEQERKVRARNFPDFEKTRSWKLPFTLPETQFYIPVATVLTASKAEETWLLGVGEEVIPDMKHDRHVSATQGTAVAHS